MGEFSIQMRAAAVSDAADILRWSNSRAIWAVDNPAAYAPKTLTDFQQSWQAMVRQKSAWMIDADSEPVGHLGWVAHAEGVCEFYIIIGEAQASGRGLGREAMHWLFQRARQSGLQALYGRVLGNNPRALSFFSQLGAVELGRSPSYFQRGGMHHDLHWLQFELSEVADQLAPQLIGASGC